MWQQHLEFLYLSLFCCKVLPLRWSSIAWTWITWVGWPKTERFPMAVVELPSFTTSSCSRKKYLETFDDLKCCVDGRPFCEGLYPTVSVPFSPNQSDLQTYDIFIVFSATDRFSSWNMLRHWGGFHCTSQGRGFERWLRVSGRLESRCKLIDVSTKTV